MIIAKLCHNNDDNNNNNSNDDNNNNNNNSNKLPKAANTRVDKEIWSLYMTSEASDRLHSRVVNDQPWRRTTLSRQTRGNRAFYLWSAIYLVEVIRTITPTIRRYRAFIVRWTNRGIC